MYRYLAALSLTLAVVLAAGCSGNEADDATATTSTGVPAARLVGVDEFAARLEDPDVVVVNVHVPDEGNLPDTDVSIPFDEISESDALPADLDTPLAVYCKSGNMSADAVADMAALGYTDVVELDGGFDAWADAGRSLLNS